MDNFSYTKELIQMITDAKDIKEVARMINNIILCGLLIYCIGIFIGAMAAEISGFRDVDNISKLGPKLRMALEKSADILFLALLIPLLILVVAGVIASACGF